MLLFWGYLGLSLRKIIFLVILYYLQNSIFVIDYSINKNVTPMVKGQIYFGLSELLTKVKILLSFCFD